MIFHDIFKGKYCAKKFFDNSCNIHYEFLSCLETNYVCYLNMIIYWLFYLILQTCRGAEYQSNYNYSDGNNQTEKWRECDLITKDFSANWYHGTRYLSRFLHRLQLLNCSYFNEQCSEQSFVFNHYTSLMYLRFCNESELKKRCYYDVKSVLQEELNSSESSSWNKLASKINFMKISKANLEKPCLQIAMYDHSQVTNRYLEIVETFVPFCRIRWCGFNEKVFNNSNISVWTCMPQT